jgi:hypothetical protein
LTTEVRRASLLKPTLSTRYHIDFDWWKKNDRDWHIFLQSYLCPEHQKLFAQVGIDTQVDWVDPQSGEVRRVDGIQHILSVHCARQPGFQPEQSALVDSVFRAFLANGNLPLTPSELGAQLGRDATTILRTLSGARVYKGLRPSVG